MGRDCNACRIDELRRDADTLPGVVRQPAIVDVGINTLRFPRTTTTTSNAYTSFISRRRRMKIDLTFFGKSYNEKVCETQRIVDVVVLAV